MTSTMTTATSTRTAFRMRCGVRTTIAASADRVWALLIDAAGYPRWNSTVTSLEGEIKEGERLKLKVRAAKDRTFTPTVSRVEAGRGMIWSDGFAPMFRGVRTFALLPNANGSTDFAMEEEFSGLMLPMVRGSLPDFVPIFEAYANDLKRAAEAGAP